MWWLCIWVDTKMCFNNDIWTSWILYVQFSSLGSLDEKWLSELAASMQEGSTPERNKLGPGQVQIVWPSVEDIRCSLEVIIWSLKIYPSSTIFSWFLHFVLQKQRYLKNEKTILIPPVQGYAAGNAVPSPQKNVERAFLSKYWSRWQADHTGRRYALLIND